MRIAAVSVALFCLLQPGLYGQSSLTFACLMEKGEMSNVTFTTINPGKGPAETTFTLYGAAGQVIGASKATIPAGGELTRRAAQLFPKLPLADGFKQRAMSRAFVVFG